MKNLYLLVCVFFIQNWVSAQSATSFDPAKMSLVWKFDQNFYEGREQNSAFLEIRNQNKKASVPLFGWTIYFNGVRGMAKKEVGFGLEVSQLNGDLYQLKPGKEFKGLPSKSSLNLHLISEAWILNYTEAPKGFYWVWDDRPSQPIAINNVVVQGTQDATKFRKNAADSSQIANAEVVFKQNENISAIPSNAVPIIFPTPASVQYGKGSHILKNTITIYVSEKFSTIGDFILADIKSYFSGIVSLVADESKANIRFHVNSSLPPEGYKLRISDAHIDMEAADEGGIFYAYQSLKSAMPLSVWRQAQPEIIIPALMVEDAPRFSYRGLHIDIARNFQTKESLMKMINWMAMYKLNVLHLHFSDDEAWRIAIPGLEELTTVGVTRMHTLSSDTHMPSTYGSGGPKSERQSGFYTRDDYIDIIQFAAARQVEIIPEIETPGHARAAIKAMQARYKRLASEGKMVDAEQYLLHDMNDKSSYKSVQFFNDNVMCPCLPSVYTFIEKVVDELSAMHIEAGSPLRTIHMGGDEVPSGVWEKSPLCEAFLKNQTKYSNAPELWMYYWEKVHAMLSKKGLYVSGWEEFAMRPTKQDGARKMIVNPEFANRKFHAYVWNNVIGFGSEDLPYRLANGGYKVILCPVSNLYFDLAYQNHFDEPGYYWGGFVDVDKPFYFVPYDYYKNTKVDRNGNAVDASAFIGKDRLTDYGKQNIVGMQGHLWSENITSEELFQYQAFPKLLGLAERAWAADPEWATTTDAAVSEKQYQEAWNLFVNTLGKRELPKLSWYQGGANYRIPTVGAVIRNNAVHANIQLPGHTIRYTVNGKEPEANSAKYEGPISAKGLISLRAFDDRGRGGRTLVMVND